MSSGIFLKLANFCLYRNIKNNSQTSATEPAVTAVFDDHGCSLCQFEIQPMRREM